MMDLTYRLFGNPDDGFYYRLYRDISFIVRTSGTYATYPAMMESMHAWAIENNVRCSAHPDQFLGW
jgi:hypothetical protein